MVCGASLGHHLGGGSPGEASSGPVFHYAARSDAQAPSHYFELSNTEGEGRSHPKDPGDIRRFLLVNSDFSMATNAALAAFFLSIS
jgi:hypothetical protein